MKTQIHILSVIIVPVSYHYQKSSEKVEAKHEPLNDANITLIYPRSPSANKLLFGKTDDKKQANHLSDKFVH